MVDHLALYLPLGPGGGNVVLPDNLQHAGTGLPGHSGNAADGIGHHRENIAFPAINAGSRKPTKLKRKQKRHHLGNPEAGHRRGNQRGKHGSIIFPCVLMNRGNNTQRHSGHNRQQHRKRRNHQCAGEAFHNLGGNAAPIDKGIAEVKTNEYILQIIPQLYQIWLVDPQLCPLGSQLLQGCIGAEYDNCRVTGCKVHNCKNQHRHHNDHWNHQQKPLIYVSAHFLFLTYGLF